MLRHIHIGPAAFQTAPVVFLIGFFLLSEISRRRATAHNTPQQPINNALTLALIIGLLMARFVYVVTHWTAYESRLQQSLALSIQGLTLEAGLVASLVVYLIYAYVKKVTISTALDILAPGIGAFMALMPLAFLANGDVIGQPTDLPWAIDLWNEMRHPVQLYATIGSALALLVWWKMPRPFAGAEMLAVIAGNALVWLLVGFLLAEPWLIVNYRGVQLLGWIALIIVAFIWGLRESATSEWHAAQSTPSHPADSPS